MRLRVAVLVLCIMAVALGSSAAAEQPVVLTLFWGDGCPHCEHEKAFLKGFQERNPWLTVREYEVWKNKQNAALYRKVLEAAKIKQTGVPCTVVGPSVFLGFTDRTRMAIEDAVARCRRDGCSDVVASLGGQAVLAPAGDTAVSVPLFGTLDPSRLSLPVFTVVIAGLDSFNPCAFFVLLFLLSMLIHARSRLRMALVGGIFVLFSGLVYFLFMAAWLNVFLVAGTITAITVTGGIIALIVGSLNVKDFFLFKQGVSLVIPEGAKPKLFSRMRGLIQERSLAALIGGTVVLAITANAYELLCTAGFPMVYTRVLTLRALSPAQYYQYLALYNVVYVVPLAIIVAVITATLGARKLTEWQGRQLKLLSGLMMLALGTVLIIEPALLNSALASVVMLGAVIAVSWVVIVIMKKLRPEIVA